MSAQFPELETLAIRVTVSVVDFRLIGFTFASLNGRLTRDVVIGSTIARGFVRGFKALATDRFNGGVVAQRTSFITARL